MALENCAISYGEESGLVWLIYEMEVIVRDVVLYLGASVVSVV